MQGIEKRIIALTRALNAVVHKLYDVENCGGDWKPGCEDILSERCAECCQGKKLLVLLKEQGSD